MPYTIGASHGPFTGRGSFVISKPAGIRSVVTSIPPFVGRDSGNPPRWFWLGRFSLGNIDGFSRSWGLEYAQQLVYPMPAIWELLSYDVRNGASCLFQELVEVPDLTAKMPWDRAQVFWSQNSAPGPSGPTVVTTAWTYTVPVGRVLCLQDASVKTMRYSVCSTVGAAQAFIKVDGTPVVSVTEMTNVVGANVSGLLSAGPLYVRPTQVISATYNNPDIGGLRLFWLEASGFLFDA